MAKFETQRKYELLKEYLTDYVSEYLSEKFSSDEELEECINLAKSDEVPFILLHEIIDELMLYREAFAEKFDQEKEEAA